MNGWTDGQTKTDRWTDRLMDNRDEHFLPDEWAGREAAKEIEDDFMIDKAHVHIRLHTTHA